MAPPKSRPVDNDIYDRYGERWYTAHDDPVALLRAEARARNGWIAAELHGKYAGGNIRILDIGCGAGFLTNYLAGNGYQITGLDTSESSLRVARIHDSSATALYCLGNASRLPFPHKTFNAVCAMDLLEHVEEPERIVREAARVLKPEGIFFFHTFNRNPLSWLVVIKGVEWFVRNTPPGMHRLGYFIKPAELKRMCQEAGLEVVQWRGLAPRAFSKPFWKMLATGIVDDRFAFRFTRHLVAGYVGMAIRRISRNP